MWGRNSTMWENYYRDAFPPGGKDYYIAGLWGGGATMGERLLYNTGSTWTRVIQNIVLNYKIKVLKVLYGKQLASLLEILARFHVKIM